MKLTKAQKRVVSAMRRGAKLMRVGQNFFCLTEGINRRVDKRVAFSLLRKGLLKWESGGQNTEYHVLNE